MAYDTVWTESKTVERSLTESDWATFGNLSFKIKREDFNTLKLWAELKTEGGTGTAYVRLELDDGVVQLQSTGVSTGQGVYTEVGPDSLNMASAADKVWTVNVQGKIASGTKVWVCGVTVQKET